MITPLPTLPQVGVAGRYKLKEPWTIAEDKIYTCSRVFSIADAVGNLGIKVLEDIYVKAGLGEDDFNSAIANRVKLVELTSLVGEPIIIPETHLDGYPHQGNIPYVRVILGLDIGLLPKDFSTAAVSEKLSEEVVATLNIVPTIKPYVYNDNTFVTVEQHEQMETIRKNGIREKKSLQQQIIELRRERSAMAVTIKELEDQLLTTVTTSG